MCGIVGYVGPQQATPIIFEGLRRLEYRGYDSAGLAVLEENGSIAVRREVGKLAALVNTVPLAVTGGLAIYLFGIIGMQGVALMVENKVNLFNAQTLAVGAIIMIVGIGGNIGYPGGFLPIPFLTGLFPNGLPAIATAAVLGIFVNAIFLIFKPPKTTF